jgi:hypothetical protein
VWVITVIAASSALEILAAWLGIGALSGFPVFTLGRARISTDWTLAICMEAYAGFALWVWLSGAKGKNSRNFALCSALGALVLSAVVQISYHLMLANGDQRAPDALVGFVAILPIIALTLAGILVHLMHLDGEAAGRSVRKAREADERTLLRGQLESAREAHAKVVEGLSGDLEGARESARQEAAVRTETAQALAAVREELRTARAAAERAENARQAAVRQREQDVSAAHEQTAAVRSELDRTRTSAAMRPVIERERDQACADASAQRGARETAETALADARRALDRAQARADTAERKLAETGARERTDAHGEELSRLSPAQARAKAYELLDADQSLTGKALADKFSLSKRWGETRKQEWLSLRSGGTEGLRAVGED